MGLGAATSPPAVESWHGIGRRRDPSCDPCCKLVFPAAFGARSPGELQLLREIAAAEGRARELGCNYAYRKQAFEHLRALAIQKQDRDAALLVLHADSEGGIDLGGGELAEVFGADFMVPVLEGYAALDGLLSPEMEAHVALNVCSSAYGLVAGEGFNLDRVARRIAERGARSLSKRLREECARILKERTP
jgi:hypothetical protein